MRLILLNIARFVLLILIQVFLLDQLRLGFLENYISLIVYISFILTFPVAWSRYFLLLASMFIGLSFDMFKDTGGIHASACLLMGFLRPFVLTRLQSQSPIDEVEELTVYTEDLQKYVIYCLLMCSAFFFWLFLLEEFSFSHLPLILLKTLLSSVFSTFLILIGQYLLFKKPKI